MEHIQNKKFLNKNLLSTETIEAIEEQKSEGMSSAEIVDVFGSRGIKFSEATFRKYVQQGLLPRSRRIGQKGKHKGSRGVYPVGTVRQINEIKRLMALDYTIEDIRKQFVFVGGELEELKRLLDSILEKLDKSAQADSSGNLAEVSIARQLDEAKKSAALLMEKIELAARKIRERARVARDAV